MAYPFQVQFYSKMIVVYTCKMVSKLITECWIIQCCYIKQLELWFTDVNADKNDKKPSCFVTVVIYTCKIVTKLSTYCWIIQCCYNINSYSCNLQMQDSIKLTPRQSNFNTAVTYTRKMAIKFTTYSGTWGCCVPQLWRRLCSGNSLQDLDLERKCKLILILLLIFIIIILICIVNIMNIEVSFKFKRISMNVNHASIGGATTFTKTTLSIMTFSI